LKKFWAQKIEWEMRPNAAPRNYGLAHNLPERKSGCQNVWFDTSERW